MDLNTESSLFELQVDHNVQSYLKETARWAKFMAILGFVFCGLIFLAAFFASSLIAAATRMGGGGGVGMAYMGGFVTVLYIGIALLYFFPCLYLYNFASKMQTALRSNDQEQLTLSFKNLKSCYRFIGILMVICLCFWGLALVIGIAGAAFR